VLRLSVAFRSKPAFLLGLLFLFPMGKVAFFSFSHLVVDWHSYTTCFTFALLLDEYLYLTFFAKCVCITFEICMYNICYIYYILYIIMYNIVTFPLLIV